LYFWGIYEMGFPEGSNMKAPRGFRFSLWSFFNAFKEVAAAWKNKGKWHFFWTGRRWKCDAGRARILK
jgi:hypothetical protein